MPKKYEVEVSFTVVADNEDDAVRRVRKVLDPIEYDLASGMRGYTTYDDCATEIKPDGREVRHA
jgi:hypothetical protein